jgi:hypothetical protein
MWTWPCKPAATEEAERLQREQREQEAREVAEQLKVAERRARLASIIAVAGLVVSVVGLGFVSYQNEMLRQQVELQKQALDISGPVLSGIALVIEDIIGPRLFNPGTVGNFERAYKAGETADRDVLVRVEVTNRGQSVGAITGASVQHGETWLSARDLMCGVAEDADIDGPRLRLVECQLPIKVEPGEIAVFTYDLPKASCSDNGGIPPKEEITASLTTTTGEVAVPSTKVFGWIQEPCPRTGE